MKKLLFILLFAPLLFQSCDVELTAEDGTAPNWSLQISGDNFNTTINQDSDLSRTLNLRSGEEFSFIFSVGDEGGVKRAAVSFAGEPYFALDSTVSAPWNHETFSIFETISWEGTRSSLVSAAITTFKIVTGDEIPSSSFRIEGSDFGGESGSSNSINVNVPIHIVDGSTGFE